MKGLPRAQSVYLGAHAPRRKSVSGAEVVHWQVISVTGYPSLGARIKQSLPQDWHPDSTLGARRKLSILKLIPAPPLPAEKQSAHKHEGRGEKRVPLMVFKFFIVLVPLFRGPQSSRTSVLLFRPNR